MTKLKELCLSDQIRVVLTDGNFSFRIFSIRINLTEHAFVAKVVRFDQLMEILWDKSIDKTLTAEKVLRTMPSVGMLVRGNWVILSEILYPADSVSSIHGVPAEFMCRARDYVVRL